jgi:hypothetical protein
MLLCSERYTKYSQVMTPYTEDWGDNRTMEWYAGKKVSRDFYIFYKFNMLYVFFVWP